MPYAKRGTVENSKNLIITSMFALIFKVDSNDAIANKMKHVKCIIYKIWSTSFRGEVYNLSEVHSPFPYCVNLYYDPESGVTRNRAAMK